MKEIRFITEHGNNHVSINYIDINNNGPRTKETSGLKYTDKLRNYVKQANKEDRTKTQ